MVFHSSYISQEIAGLAYAGIVSWAVIESDRRWATIVWFVISLLATVGVFFAMILIWPDLTELISHVAVIISILVSTIVGLSYMRGHGSSSAKSK